MHLVLYNNFSTLRCLFRIHKAKTLAPADKNGTAARSAGFTISVQGAEKDELLQVFVFLAFFWPHRMSSSSRWPCHYNDDNHQEWPCFNSHAFLRFALLWMLHFSWKITMYGIVRITGLQLAVVQKKAATSKRKGYFPDCVLLCCL